MSLLGKWFGFSKDEVFDEGVAAYERGDYDAAIEAFAQCLEDRLDTSTLRLATFYLGESYSHLGTQRFGEDHFEEALYQYRKALKHCPQSPDLHLKAARASEATGDKLQRNIHLESALKINPRFVEAVLYQGVCLYGEGRHAEGIERIEEACRMDSELQCDRYRRAMAAHSDGDSKTAFHHLRMLSSAGSSDAALHKKVGDGYLREDRFEEAESALRKAIQIHPRYPEAFHSLSRVLERMRRFPEALEAADRAINLDPSRADGHVRKGEVLQAMERELDARCEFHRAQEIDPNHPVLLRTKARLV